MAKYYPPMWCIDCKTAFMPNAGNQKRCKKCAEKHKLEYVKAWNKEHAERARETRAIRNADNREKRRIEREAEQRKKASKPRKKPIMSWPEIIRVCEENHISYGKAVAKGLVK